MPNEYASSATNSRIWNLCISSTAVGSIIDSEESSLRLAVSTPPCVATNRVLPGLCGALGKYTSVLSSPSVIQPVISSRATPITLATRTCLKWLLGSGTMVREWPTATCFGQSRFAVVSLITAAAAAERASSGVNLNLVVLMIDGIHFGGQVL